MTITHARLLPWFFLLTLISPDAYSQTKTGYTLTVSTQQASGGFDFLGLASRPLQLNAEVRSSTYEFRGTIPGRLKIMASADSILSASNVVILDSACTLPDYAYKTFPIKHSLKPGSYYLFSQFTATDQRAFEAGSNTVRTAVQLIDLTIAVNNVWFSHTKTSEYSEETHCFAEVELTLSGSTTSLGSFRSEWQINLVKGKKATPVNTSYRTDSLHAGKNVFVIEESLFDAPDFARQGGVSIAMKSAYFSEGYLQVNDVVLPFPLKVVTNIDEINAGKRARYPFLTYGDFTVKQQTLDSASVERLFSEAEKFYSLYTRALEATAKDDTNRALHLADSAFAFVGNHRTSSLLYVSPGLVSGLYAGLFHYQRVRQRSTDLFNQRLGEALNMDYLMTTAYADLLTRVLPDSLDLYNDMEKTGSFDKPDAFNQPAITDLPIIWRARTLPALEHFIRSTDYEQADRIINQSGRHLELMRPVLKTIRQDTALTKHFSSVAHTFTESNDGLGLFVAQLEYYAASGLYEEGGQAVEDAFLAFAGSYKFAPERLWMASARFYETLGNLSAADSIYQLCDDYFRKQYAKTPEPVFLLNGKNKELLQAKTGSTIKDESLYPTLEEIRKKNLFLYLDLLNDRTLGQKLGYFGNAVYKSFYLNRIEQLEQQHQSFQANDWMKELAFLLGREGDVKNAVTLYKSLFLIDNLKATAFQLGFSEEAQLFYAQRQQETVSRFINTLQEYKATATPSAYDSALQVALQQVLFQHAFVLHGNFRMLYDVYHSPNEEVAKTYTLWQQLREYLNELYVKDDEGYNDRIPLLKKYILTIEKKLIREARDTSTMRPDYIPPLDSIRAKLKDDEAAIEIVRYQVNHKTYYDKTIAYGALIITKNNPLQFVPFPTNGADLEGKFYKRYRNTILFRQPDTHSYSIYWQPLKAHLQNIKTVYFAAEGVFNLINLNTLLNTETNQYLLSEYVMHQVPTVPSLRASQPMTFSSATLLGNPAFTDKPFTTRKADTVRTSREFFSQQAIAALPGTASEVDAIARVLRATNKKVTLLTQHEATKQALFTNSSSDVLHLATHGFWLDKPGSKSAYHNLFATLAGSGLVLAGAQKTENNSFALQAQGILTSAEMQDLNLFNTKLVVLSACETGLGEIVPGGGLYGLKRALHKAGAQNVITSLWKVDDEATMHFMTWFYQLLSEQKPLTDAFRQTMIGLKEKYPDPYYWGAFVLTEH